jgi:oligoribonuclease NrnB/cAMP/cGMP phosphodiesterase (DHH superfamily)
MKKAIEYDYEKGSFPSLESLKEHYFCQIPDENFDNYIHAKKYNFIESYKWCKQQNLSENANEYLIFKQEIEQVLERRNVIEIAKVLLNGGGHPNTKDIKKEEDLLQYLTQGTTEYFIQEMERIYYEFYHEDKNFRPELIKTPIEELRTINFG